MRVLDGPAEGTYELNQSQVKVGRTDIADIALGHGSVSKLHFSLELTATGVRLRDLASTNGTWFAERRIEVVHIEPGDEFLAGECRVRLESVDEIEVDALEGTHFGLLRGSSLPMRELYAQLEALGPTPLDVLILGETGTGKELTARTLHELSRRRGALKILDCAALSSTLADGTLFGFRKGAFTGADRDQPGIFEEADGGTLFIDEVGELPLELQRKLLGVLERREVARLGEPGKPRAIDVRLVAATHRDLRQCVVDGTFREDLYYRLARATVRTPPLRERGADIQELAQLFLARLTQRYGLNIELGGDAVAALLRHDWPGNVRELRNVVERAAHFQRHGTIGVELLKLGGTSTQSPAHSLSRAISDDKTYTEIHTELDRLLLPRLLERFDHNISHISQHLDVSRDTLRKRLKQLGLYSKR